ncbi:MAG: hypothetical protein GXX95_10330 [Methanomassiliicoccus sp.]|nr:hypothetical protein [Methanomassiliicoccus sp.]
MICPNCTTHVAEQATFCYNCGKQIAGSVDQKQILHVQSNPKFMALPPELNGVIILRPTEGILGVWSARKYRREHTRQGDKDVYDPGYLVASNQRVFYIKESGLIKKSYAAIETIAYENMAGASAKNGLFSSALIIGHEHGETRLVHLCRIDSNGQSMGKPLPEEVQLLLNQYAQERHQEIEREKKRSRVQYVLDFSFLKAEMEKGGVIVQTIKCPACSAGLTLPSTGNNISCPYCGSMVYAQDIFEKMKGLIGT